MHPHARTFLAHARDDRHLLNPGIFLFTAYSDALSVDRKSPVTDPVIAVLTQTHASDALASFTEEHVKEHLRVGGHASDVIKSGDHSSRRCEDFPDTRQTATSQAMPCGQVAAHMFACAPAHTSPSPVLCRASRPPPPPTGPIFNSSLRSSSSSLLVLTDPNNEVGSSL